MRGKRSRLQDVPAGEMLDTGHGEPASGGASDPAEPRQTERLIAAPAIAGGICVRLVRAAAEIEHLLELVQVVERGRLVPQIGIVRLTPFIGSEARRECVLTLWCMTRRVRRPRP